MKIGFYCDIHLSNYTEHPDQYVYLHGKHSATGYYYWILKNNSELDVHLIHDREEIDDHDAIVFHYDDRDVIDSFRGIKIQVVSDRPCVSDCDVYVAANQCVFTNKFNAELVKIYGVTNILNTWIADKSKWKFVHYPPTFGVKKCDPEWPPVTFKFVGRESTNIPAMLSNQTRIECEKLGANLVFDFTGDGNTGDEDVYFCVREPFYKGKTTDMQSNCGPGGHKTANRLYQTWFMNTPGIFNNSPEMYSIRTSEYDYLIANDVTQFLDCVERLRTDEILFNRMVETSKQKTFDNPYHDITIIVDQWNQVIEYLHEK